MTDYRGSAEEQAAAAGIDLETLERMRETITTEDTLAEAEEVRAKLTKFQELTELVYALEDAADGHEHAAEHLLDLLDVSVEDTPLFPSVRITGEGELEIGSTKVLPKGVEKFSTASWEGYFTVLAARHTINAAAYRREAKRIQRVMDREN